MTINHREPGYVFPMLLLLEDEKIIFSIHNLFYKAILSKGGCFHASMSLQNTEPHLSRPCLAHLEFISQLRTLLFKETILKMFAGENTRHSRGFRGCISVYLRSPLECVEALVSPWAHTRDSRNIAQNTIHWQFYLDKWKCWNAGATSSTADLNYWNSVFIAWVKWLKVHKMLQPIWICLCQKVSSCLSYIFQ